MTPPADATDPNSLAALGHDLNNLLTVIGGYATLLLETAPPGEATDFAAEIEKASKDATKVVRELLAKVQPRRGES
ncbi:histidine kinase dimerization/phospho-acceptor domain-containing protein [Limnoglobus roseus]|uniref:histidine kinase n=1 Tax=Limnoglobus roseus TaxID=2598579 RepID=A0A5C1AJL1_9BACT|nr:histidine kinase dimerization/phospho-acceptor domain-containing protein [Limnoglobus roseus]QEL18865.1 PAS domain S-box protein [Limnoglobus roseus]